MSLETVVEDIRDEARARAEEIISDADERAEEIVAEAEADKEDTLAEAEAEIEKQIEQEQEQRLSSAKLEAKQERLEARRDALERVYDAVKTELTELDEERRRELTTALLDSAAAEFEDDAEIDVYGRPGDEELLASILDSYDGFEFAGEHDCLGGVVLESDSSNVRVNNTFDAVLEEVWEDNLRDISTRLFDQ